MRLHKARLRNPNPDDLVGQNIGARTDEEPGNFIGDAWTSLHGMTCQVLSKGMKNPTPKPRSVRESGNLWTAVTAKKGYAHSPPLFRKPRDVGKGEDDGYSCKQREGEGIKTPVPEYVSVFNAEIEYDDVDIGMTAQIPHIVQNRAGIFSTAKVLLNATTTNR